MKNNKKNKWRKKKSVNKSNLIFFSPSRIVSFKWIYVQVSFSCNKVPTKDHFGNIFSQLNIINDPFFSQFTVYNATCNRFYHTLDVLNINEFLELDTIELNFRHEIYFSQCGQFEVTLQCDCVVNFFRCLRIVLEWERKKRREGEMK